MGKLLDKIAEKLEPLNFCHASEDSLTWRVLCFLFPECWCCSGIRGTVYGIILAVVVMLLMGFRL